MLTESGFMDNSGIEPDEAFQMNCYFFPRLGRNPKVIANR